jgi:hypothetical protein
MAARCCEVNTLRGLRCDRVPGHTGCHVQDDGRVQIGWGFSPVGRSEDAVSASRTAPTLNLSDRSGDGD